MKIKIGNFNFISDRENKLSAISDVHNFMEYFYLDGQEDTIYVDFNYRFNDDRFLYEKELAKNHYIIEYQKVIKNNVDSFIKNIAFKKYMNNDYLRYNLYNNISLYEIEKIQENINYKFEYYHGKEFDFDNNRIIIDGLVFNPYTHKIDNLEELYKSGNFDSLIKFNIINYEIENNKAPKFIYEILKIKDFIKDKEFINIKYNDNSKEKIKTHHFIDKYNNTISFHSSKDYNEINSISFNRKELPINIENLEYVENQIIKTPTDKLMFKKDELYNDIYIEYRNYREKFKEDYFKKNQEVCDIPDFIQYALNEITRNDISEIKEKPEWYSEELEKIFEKYTAIKRLNDLESMDDLKEIAIELNDADLMETYKWFEKAQQEDEEDEEI